MSDTTTDTTMHTTIPDNYLTISDIVKHYKTTHAQLHRWLRDGTIPSSAVQRQKYKGRQGWRSVIMANVLLGLPLTRRDTPLTTISRKAAIAAAASA